MKLSEAMRKGCEMIPQQGRYFLVEFEFDLLVEFEFDLCTGSIQNACALGSAAVAVVGLPFDGEDYAEYMRRLHDALETMGAKAGDPTYETIGARNDGGESREAIADWLEQQGL